MDWRVEGWKGNYLNMGVGGEIGLYYRTPTYSKLLPFLFTVSVGLAATERYFTSILCATLITHYYVVQDKDMMFMSFNLYNGKAQPQNLLFQRPRQKHWWITGFRPGIGTIPANQLTMTGTIEFFSEEMGDEFITNLIQEQFGMGNKPEATNSKGKVTFTWQ